MFDALAYPTIVLATKLAKPVAADQAANDVWALNWDSSNPTHQVIDFPEVFAAERFAVPQNELKPGGWQLEPPAKRRLLERLRKAGQPLGEYCKGRFYRGVLTGLNEAFVISREQRDALVAQDPKSAEIIKPFLRGRDVKRWNVEFEEQYLIKIESSENVSHVWSDLPPDKAEKKFAKTYPSIYAWFTGENHRQQLIARTDQGRYFWELRSCAYWDEFLEPKIVIPAITGNVNYAADLSGFFSNDKTSVIVSEDWRYVLAILNSAISWWLTRQLFASKMGGFFEFKPMYVSALPIPQITAEQRCVVEPLADAVIANIIRPEYERLLNSLVYELFFPEDLHAKNIRLFDACAAAGIQQGMDGQAVAARIFRNDHPIYGMLFDLPSLDVVRVIEGRE